MNSSRIVLRVELEQAIARSGCTLSKLQKLGGPHIGNLSTALQTERKELRPISMKQLDSLTKALGLPEGLFYDSYLSECFLNGRVSKPRMQSFLIRCAELKKNELIVKAINMLLEHPKYTELLFSVAEKLYSRGLIEESLLFYEEIIEEEKYNHSDRLAISHYRIFRATIGANAEENYEAVIRFEDFRKKLPESFQLDALLQLANVCLSLGKWELTEQFADELRIVATIRYQEELLKKKNNCESMLNTERPLVVYYGQSYLLKSVVLFKQGHYEKTKQYIEGYEDLSWFEILDEQGMKEVDNFRLWARANKYSIELLLGNVGVLDEYTNYLAENPNEILTGLARIIEAANAHGFSIEHILERFPEFSTDNNKVEIIRIEQHFRFHYQKAMYALNQQHFTEGLETLLYCLSLSISNKKHFETVLCAAQFQKHIKYASDSHKEQFAIHTKQILNSALLPAPF